MGTIHLIGAYAAFGCGTLYECIQTYITYKMHPEVNGLRVFSVRLMCSILSIAACFGGMCIFQLHNYILFNLISKCAMPVANLKLNYHGINQ